MQEIRCAKCGKLLLEAKSGEGKKVCPKCKTVNHYIVTSLGTFVFDEENMPKGEICFK